MFLGFLRPEKKMAKLIGRRVLRDRQLRNPDFVQTRVIRFAFHTNGIMLTISCTGWLLEKSTTEWKSFALRCIYLYSVCGTYTRPADIQLLRLPFMISRRGCPGGVRRDVSSMRKRSANLNSTNKTSMSKFSGNLLRSPKIRWNEATTRSSSSSSIPSREEDSRSLWSGIKRIFLLFSTVVVDVTIPGKVFPNGEKLRRGMTCVRRRQRMGWNLSLLDEWEIRFRGMFFGMILFVRSSLLL